MKCDDCAFAQWERTSTGRLHPGKSGRCTRLEKHPLDLRIPEAFYWFSAPSSPSGGWIRRGNELKQKCVFKTGATP
jgi:hypothetical protein